MTHPSPDPTQDESARLAELRTRIAELEENGQFGDAAQLKSELVRPPAPSLTTGEAEELTTLRAQVNKLEAAGKYGAAAPLKTRIMRLTTNTHR